MQLVIAEKPSVAQSIAAVLGANQKESGCLTGNGYVVSWCIGHLVALAPAHAYDTRYAQWRMEDLPILPEHWQYQVCEAAQKQFAIVKRLLNDPRMDVVICATDAGREGELIFRLVYAQSGCEKPVKRLWISSLEENAIRDGFLSLRDGREFDLLYLAALCRAQADWLVGINASRLYSLLYGQTLNVGRVMSPTLALLVAREAAVAAFQPEPFYTVQISCGFLAWTERIQERSEAEHIQQMCHLQTATVKSIGRKRKQESPPKLYDLTTLQREANRLFGYTAQQTLDYAQSLYEKQLITYPRTDSRYLIGDMGKTLPQLVRAVADAMPFTAGLDLPVGAGQVIDAGKVSDHHAILPTRLMAQSDPQMLPAGERDILQMISVRLLCAVGGAHIYDETTVALECEGVTFTAKGQMISQMGWKIPEATYHGSIGERIWREPHERAYPLPELQEGQKLGPVLAVLKEGRTTPPKHYTEDSLLAAMETAGAEETPEDAERKGLGTPATRAGILEKLIAAGLMERKGDKHTKHLLPTAKGRALIAVLPEQLRSPMLTAEWEQRFKRIERGEESPDSFMRDIRAMLTDLTVSPKPAVDAQTLFPPRKKSVGVCPHCGMTVNETPKGYFCGNQGCRFGVWKDNRFLANKSIALTPELMTALLKTGAVQLKGLRSRRTGKTYDARLFLTTEADGLAKLQMKFDNERKNNGGS